MGGSSSQAFQWLLVKSVLVDLLVPGAVEYLRDALSVCGQLQLSVYIYAFRECDFDVFNYELGTNHERNPSPAGSLNDNPFYRVISQALAHGPASSNPIPKSN
jgi:hypothetical protein